MAVSNTVPDEDTSSADPAALIAYSDVGLRIDAELEASAARLAAVLDQFAATCTEYPLGIDGNLANPLRDLARRNREHNLWVRSVAEQYLAADGGELVMGGLIPADGTGSPLPPTGPNDVAGWEPIVADPNDWAEILSLGPPGSDQFGTSYSSFDLDLSPEQFDPWQTARDGLTLFMKAVGDAPTNCNDAFLKIAQAVQDGPEAVQRALQSSRPTCGQSRSLIRLSTVLADGSPLDLQQEMSLDDFAMQMASVADQLGGGGAAVRRPPVPDEEPPPAMGPGTWVRVNRNGVSQRALDYQNRVTGSRSGWEYGYNDVKFDGYDAFSGALLDAKGERYAYLLDPANRRWSTAAEGILGEADRQVRAAKGRRIIWYVAEEGAAKRIKQIFSDNYISGIEVIFKP